jgi:hypothetical protein
MATDHLAFGTHTLEARSSDGERDSQTVAITFSIDQPPTVAIEVHVDGKKYKDVVRLKGISTDDGGVDRVELRIDGGEWVEVEGTTAWTYKVPTKGLTDGQHTVDLRAFDGLSYSEEISTTFKFEKSKGPGFELIAVLVAMLVVVPIIRSRRKG